MIKEYTYQVFLRDPTTKEVQYGTVTIESDGYLYAELLFPWLAECCDQHFSPQHVLLGFNIVECKDI